MSDAVRRSAWSAVNTLLLAGLLLVGIGCWQPKPGHEMPTPPEPTWRPITVAEAMWYSTLGDGREDWSGCLVRSVSDQLMVRCPDGYMLVIQ